MIAFICASGTHIPPFYIFPRVKFISRMTEPGPPGCLGLAHPSGWVTKDTFLQSLQHFVKFTTCSSSNPHLLLLDNHSSHLDHEVIKYAKQNGIVMLTFPPHCSHKLQPLDVSVFGPFKGALKTSFDDWLNLHSGSRISIHDIAELSREPFLQKFNPINITKGFSKSGIHPLNRFIFNEIDYLPSTVTDRTLGIFLISFIFWMPLFYILKSIYRVFQFHFYFYFTSSNSVNINGLGTFGSNNGSYLCRSNSTTLSSARCSTIPKSCPRFKSKKEKHPREDANSHANTWKKTPAFRDRS